MTPKLKLSSFTIFLVVLIITVYTIWFVFFQEVIQFILENAISTYTGERDVITGWMGVFLLPFLGVMGIMGILYGILFLREKIKDKK